LALAMVMKSTRDFSTCSARWSPVRGWGRSRYFREQYPKRVGKMLKTMDWEIFISCAISRIKTIRSEINTSQIRTSCCRFRGRSPESWDSLSGVFQIVCLMILTIVEYKMARGPKASASLLLIMAAGILSSWRTRMWFFWLIRKLDS
jgi:hypothetical protein